MSNRTTNQRRHFHRILYNAKADLISTEKNWDCEILDLSLNGCLLEFEHTWQGDPEQLYTLIFNLSDEIKIQMELSVSHAIDHKVGFKCEHIDIDSISQLRRLVELNLGDSAVLERDLLALAE